MEFTIKISFGKSSSPNYQKVIRASRQFSNFSPISKDNTLNTIALDLRELREKFRKIESLWEAVRNWKSSQFLVNDERRDFDYVRKCFMIFTCSESFHKAVIPESHCKQFGGKTGWGCKYLTSIGIGVSEPYYSYGNELFWYSFGEFTNDTVWRINKEKIRGTLQREVMLRNLFLCEVFDSGKIETIICGLPDEIDVEKSELWEIDYEESSDGVTLEKIAEGIKPKERTDGGIEVTPTEQKSRYIPDIGFEDIGGIEEIIETIREVIELPLKQPELFNHLGIKPHRGILLHGPPGCGKTLIAKAIANEIKAHFIPISGPELLSKWHGQSEENLRRVFEEARKMQPSIIFFDEIDAIAQERSAEENLRVDSKFVNQLLTLMDGMESYENVCVIASSNKIKLIDRALLRPGRFDYAIKMEKPNRDACYKIFLVATSNMPLSNSFDSKEFSEKLYGLSGAEISFVAREAAYNCLRRSIDLEKVIKEEHHGEFDYETLIIEDRDFDSALATAKNQREEK